MNFTDADKAKREAIRDLLYNGPLLTLYLGAMELVTSSDKTTVTVANTVRKVMSVWLASDPEYEGDDYYSEPKALNFTGSTITLDKELPATNTEVRVAYYADCPDCEWNAETRTSRDSQCSTCGGAGKTLALGDALEIPIKRLSRGMLLEKMGLTGEEASGVVAFRAKAEHENMIRASIKLVFNDRTLETPEEGEVSIDREYSGLTSQPLHVTVIAPYKTVQ